MGWTNGGETGNQKMQKASIRPQMYGETYLLSQCQCQSLLCQDCFQHDTGTFRRSMIGPTLSPVSAHAIRPANVIIITITPIIIKRPFSKHNVYRTRVVECHGHQICFTVEHSFFSRVCCYCIFSCIKAALFLA